MPRRDLHDVVAITYDGLCTFEFGIVVEVFGLPRPEMGPHWYRFHCCSVDGRRVRAIGGVIVESETTFARLARAGTIVIPGWKSPHETPPMRLLEALRRAHARGARLVS